MLFYEEVMSCHVMSCHGMSCHAMLRYVMLCLTSSLLKALSSTDELPTKFNAHIISTANLQSVPFHRLRQWGAVGWTG